jgi:hypothetical protein
MCTLSLIQTLRLHRKKKITIRDCLATVENRGNILVDLAAPRMHVALVVRLATLILEIFIVALTSWIPSLVMEAIVGPDISLRENSEKGFFDVFFVNVTGINAAVEVAGVFRSFHTG